MKKLCMFCAFCTLSFNFLMAQNLLNNPEHVAYDKINDRYLVANYGNGKVIYVDQSGGQDVFLENIPSCMGIHIIDSLVFVSAGASVYMFGLNSQILLQTIHPSVDNWLDGMIHDNNGYLYVAENSGKIHRIDLEEYSDTVIVDEGLPSYPQDLAYDEENNRLLLICWQTYAPIVSVDLETYETSEIIQTNSGKYDGIAMDNESNIYVTSWLSGGRVYKWEPPYTEDPIVFSEGHSGPAGLCIDTVNEVIVVPNFNSNSLSYVPLSTSDIADVKSNAEFTLFGDCIHIETSEICELIISDILGKCLVRETLPPMSDKLDLNMLLASKPDGFYLISLKSSEHLKTIKFIKQ